MRETSGCLASLIKQPSTMNQYYEVIYGRRSARYIEGGEPMMSDLIYRDHSLAKIPVDSHLVQERLAWRNRTAIEGLIHEKYLDVCLRFSYGCQSHQTILIRSSEAAGLSSLVAIACLSGLNVRLEVKLGLIGTVFIGMRRSPPVLLLRI